MNSCSWRVSFAVVFLLGVHSGEASKHQIRGAATQRGTEDTQLSKSSDPAEELIEAADGLTAQLDSFLPPAATAPATAAVSDVGAPHTEDSSSWFERQRRQQEVVSLQEEVADLQAQLGDMLSQERSWRAVASEAQQQQTATTKELEEKTKKITQFARATADRQAQLKQQLHEAQARSEDNVALHGARDQAVKEEKLWEGRAREAESRLVKTIEAQNAVEKENKRMEFQLQEVNETAVAAKQQYQLALQMSEDKAHRRQAQLNQQLQAAEAKVRAADQRARTIDTNAHAAIKIAKEKYKELQKAAAQQERTMASELQDAQVLAQSSMGKAVKQLRSPGAARTSSQAAPQRALRL